MTRCVSSGPLWEGAGSASAGFSATTHGHDTIWFSGGTPGSAPNFTRFVDDKLTVIVLANLDAMDSEAMTLGVAQFFLTPPRSIEANDPYLTQQLQRRLIELAAEPNSFYKDLGSLQSFHLIRQTSQDGKRVRAYRAAFENAELIQAFTLTTSSDIAEVSVRFE